MANVLMSGCVNFGGSLKSWSLYSGVFSCRPVGGRVKEWGCAWYGRWAVSWGNFPVWWRGDNVFGVYRRQRPRRWRARQSQPDPPPLQLSETVMLGCKVSLTEPFVWKLWRKLTYTITAFKNQRYTKLYTKILKYSCKFRLQNPTPNSNYKEGNQAPNPPIYLVVCTPL